MSSSQILVGTPTTTATSTSPDRSRPSTRSGRGSPASHAASPRRSRTRRPSLLNWTQRNSARTCPSRRTTSRGFRTSSTKIKRKTRRIRISKTRTMTTMKLGVRMSKSRDWMTKHPNKAKVKRKSAVWKSMPSQARRSMQPRIGTLVCSQI